jgi:hypothetical protein
VSKIEDGGPAFPRPDERGLMSEGLLEGSFGMSLRDWFAGQALSTAYCNENSTDPDKVAEWAFQLAGAMIAARKTGGSE